jgi:hypothetical protein
VETNSIIGSINQSTMPWRTTVDMKIDKSFTLTFGEGENSRQADLNFYLDVSNLLNTQNVMGVYATTGNPDDDAVLPSTGGQSNISRANSQQSYIDYYTMMLDNPANYNLPRQIRLGVLFSF